MSAREEIEQFKRDVLAREYSKLLPQQKKFFDRVFRPVMGQKPDGIMAALDLIERTLRKNQKLGRTENPHA